MNRKLICFVAAGLMLAIAGGVQAQPVDGQVLVLYWYGGGVDNNLDNLKGNARFPDIPDEVAYLTALDQPDRPLDYWGAQLMAVLTPPETGDYTFWTASDDDSEVWLSTDTDPANATMICSVEGWTGYYDWAGATGAPGDNQQSDPIPLVAGQQYYIEMLFSDGTGGGFGSVAWAGPGIGEEPTVIAGEYLAADAAWIPAGYYQAKDPSPADGELDVTMALLTWTPGTGAALHTVYFGDSPDTLAVGMGANPTPNAVYYYPLPLTPGATYYWRVDETTDTDAVYEGQVWSFTVMPLEASRPSPADGAVYVPTEIELSWAAGQAAQNHAVYVGTDEALVAAGDPSVLAATIEETSHQLTGLDPGKTYYWRVDELGGITGDVAGPVWSFSTYPTIESPVVEPGLVGLWTFDTEPESSFVALDMTGNGHDGIVKGAITFVDDFYKGAVLKLPGGSNQFVDIGPVGISGNDPTTIACWAKADHTSIPDWTLIFGFTTTGGGDGSHFNVGSLGGPGGVGAHCWGWEETIFSDREALEWHHYAMTYDGTTITYYGDGVQMDTDEAKSNERDLSIRADNVHIGSRITQDSSFPGMVDDCRVYDRVLTADEIAAIGANPDTIVWVSFHGADDAPTSGAADAGFTEAPDIGYTDLLKGAGYNVMRYVTTKTPDTAVLNAADLVIISRSVDSSHYSNDAATTWNGISAPMIILGGYPLRKQRMGYTTGNTMVDTTGDVKLTVLDPEHPVFAGIALTDGTMDNPYAGICTYPDGTSMWGISINTDAPDDDVVVLAVIADASAGPAGGTMIAEVPAGAVLNHDGGAGTDILAGPRLIFLTGAREDNAGGISSTTAGVYDLYDDGTLMLLNAVDYMLNPPPPPPSANLLTNGGFETGTQDGWGGYGDNTREVVTELVGADVPEPPAEGTYCMHVVVNSAGANFWDGGVQTYSGQVFEAGKQYTFSVWLKCATGTRMVNIKPEIAADPWTGYGDQQVTITDTWAEYHVTTPVFESDVTPTSITLHIQYEPGEFWIDDAKFYEGQYVAPPGAETVVYDFETDAQGWGNLKDGTAVTVSSETHSAGGSQSLMATIDEAAHDQQEGGWASSRDFTVDDAAGGLNILSFWYRVDDPDMNGGNIVCHWISSTEAWSGGGWYGNGLWGVLIADGQWHQQTFDLSILGADAGGWEGTWGDLPAWEFSPDLFYSFEISFGPTDNTSGSNIYIDDIVFSGPG